VKVTFGIKERVIAFTLLLASIAIFSGLYLLRQVKQRDRLIKKVTEDYQPSISTLEQLADKFDQGRKIVNYLAVVTPENRVIFKNEFNNLFHTIIPGIGDQLIKMSANWDEEDQQLMFSTIHLVNDSLYFSYLDYLRSLDNTSRNNTETAGIPAVASIRESNIPFLTSEIDQYLSYLTNKRKLEVNAIFNEITDQRRVLNRNILLISLVFTLCIIAFVVTIYEHLRRSIRTLREKLHDLSIGKIPEPMTVPVNSEYTSVTRNMNQLFRYLRSLTAVSERILTRDLTSEFIPLSKEDELGNALANLQANLKNATNEAIKHETEDRQRKWVSDGIAHINDILRSAGDDIKVLGNELIESLVSLTGSCVGGLFIVNNENSSSPFAELMASYAFDRRKQIQKHIAINEGLVGRCVLENETIHITDVPKGYIRIKTGLGEDDPRSILIVPLHLNNSVYGVVELASFAEYGDYFIHFVETVGENIATTLSKVQVNRRTSQLLEQTKQQAEEMLSQEEEMRQNMEELRVLQDQAARREEKLLRDIDELKKNLKGSDNP